ncbi:Activator of Hsp90 ATPase homolog 1-like protein [Tsukamurella paurometabola]|uniref:Activator of Hsp90 ATPase homolog 1-like protein n=2 Tax=Tsukamurella paurometabola TaxID=2061 RepID=A0A3P8KN05_TSUPA|nr:Activator of Hsp90 ATPase homolog 1-like protein [Tsukamurella paurometabola]
MLFGMATILERTVSASPARVWELWTTPAGISAWWAPEGFRTDVTRLDLAPGGELAYTMTAVAPDQVAFMEQNGMPLATRSVKFFAEVEEPSRLSYRSVIDFVPDREPYEHLTVVELHPDPAGTRVVMHVEPMHDEVWTERLVAGRGNELDNLAALVAAE